MMEVETVVEICVVRAWEIWNWRDGGGHGVGVGVGVYGGGRVDFSGSDIVAVAVGELGGFGEMMGRCKRYKEVGMCVFLEVRTT
jgi:hypothetical protein